jgi:hypothetical protein
MLGNKTMISNSKSVKLSGLPTTIKSVIGLFITHILLYAISVFWALNHRATFDPRFLLHILVVVFLTSNISKPRVGLFFLVLAYSLYIPSKWLLDDQSWGTVILSLPMYIAAVCLVAGRAFYFSNPTSKSKQV